MQAQGHVIRTPDTPWEVTFDGGAREIKGQRVAGSGAALWGNRDHNGRIPLIATCLVPLPTEEHAQIAEAWGCRAALDMVRSHTPAGSRVTVTGDNLAVVRQGAGQGGIRQAHIGLVIDRKLASCVLG